MKDRFINVITELKSICVDFPYPIYAVGGCVRDLILGAEIKDVDIVVAAPHGEKLLTEFITSKYPGKIINIVENIKYGTNRFDLILSDGSKEQIDCAMTRSETYKEDTRKPDNVEYADISVDSLRRDFTLNALYYDVKTNAILDPTGKGLEDLRNKILRTPLDPLTTFKEDSLRMLRAVRFKHCKNFNLCDEVVAGISQAAEFIKTTAKERISEELLKILRSNTPDLGITDLHELGLLGYIIPELDNYWDMDQKSKYHHLSFSGHTLEVLKKTAEKSKKLELRLAALLHDIAKPTPSGHQEKSPEHWTYIGHDKESAKLASKICLENLKLSKKFTKEVTFFVENHMIIKPFYDYKTKTFTGKDSQVRKVIRTLGDYLGDTMILVDADNTSHHPDFCMIGQVQQFLDKTKIIKVPDYSTPIINGTEAAKILGVKPGQAINTFLELINHWRDENPDLTKEDIINYTNEKRGFNKKFIEQIKNDKL